MVNENARHHGFGLVGQYVATFAGCEHEWRQESVVADVCQCRSFGVADPVNPRPLNAFYHSLRRGGIRFFFRVSDQPARYAIVNSHEQGAS